MQSPINKLHSLNFISEITPADQVLLQTIVEHMRPESKNYEDSWGYIIQATRYNGFKWYDPSTNSLIFFGRKSDSDPTLVVPNFFAEPKYLANAVNKVQHELKAQQTVLKNINPSESASFFPYGFRRYKKGEKWNTFAPFDDQTYPQLVIDLKKLSDLQGKVYKKLRILLNKKLKLIIREYIDEDINKVLDLFAYKDGNTKIKIRKAKGMYYVSHIMYPTADIDKFVIIDKTTNEIVGFTAISDITSKNTAYVASIFKPGTKIASIWGIYQTLIKKYQAGFHLINLGGCESEGTYNFMRWLFQPVEQIEKTHLIYSPKIKVKHI